MNGTRPALFRHRYLVYATLVFSALVLMLLLIVSGQRGVLHPVVIGSAVALISSFYVTIEFLRARFRFSIRAILVAMFGIGLACALWGQTFLLVSRQRAAVNRVRIIGGSATQRTYDGHWAVTGAGWVLPAPLANRLGVDLTEQLSAVHFDGDWIRGDEFENVDTSVFKDVYIYNCQLTESRVDDGIADFSALDGITGLFVSRCKLNDIHVKSMGSISTLESLFIVCGDDISGDALMALTELQNAKQITLVGFPQLNEASLSELRRNHPKCEWTWNSDLPY